jgi:hypothetical protein
MLSLRNLSASLLCLSLGVSIAAAGSPLDRMSLFKKLEADPTKKYPLDESRGPWLILASTFYGEDAEKQADALVLELRREHKLPAYRHQMTWDFSNPVQGRGVDEYGRPKVMKHANYEQRREIAVLVGDFVSLDDPTAQKTLEIVRNAKPQCLDPEYITKQGQKNARAFAGWRTAAMQMISNDDEVKRRGPMGKAFLVANPMIPKEYFRPRGIDPILVRMNEPLEHNLMKCPGTYSVKVATFTGTMISLPNEIEKIERGEKQMSSRLERAALQAHNLTAALRAKGYEAYEFHDEGESVVTVGSFETVGSPRADGKIEINPEMHKIIKQFGAVITNDPKTGKPTPGPSQTLAGIPFDVQPVPVAVPKRSIANDYAAPRMTQR